MRFSLKGVHVPKRKEACVRTSVLPLKSEVTIPMSMHIGKPDIPCVSVGDEVFVGTIIAKQDGYISSPIHSSVSGKVKSVIDITLPSGQFCSAIKIESDQKMNLDPKLAPPIIREREDFVKAIRDSGIVGLGGAGFPAYIKFDVEDIDSIDTLVINGAECEPYLVCDTRTMIDNRFDMFLAIEEICKYFNIKEVIIGIEKNNSEAISSMKELSKKDSRIRICVLSDIYPQGAEKVLVYNSTGRIIPAGKLPLDVGIIVSNCTTIAKIGEYIRFGIPLVSKCVTVCGGAVKEPQNVIAPIGTPITDLIEFTGGLKSEPYKILLGGPMMGYSVESFDMWIMKNTNAIICLTEEESKTKKETACIHCGSCVRHCPLNLNPVGYLKAYNKGDIKELERMRVDICMECGCCSYVCPASKPLVEVNRLAKLKLKEYSAMKNKK